MPLKYDSSMLSSHQIDNYQHTYKKPFIPALLYLGNKKTHKKKKNHFIKFQKAKRKWRCLDSNHLFKGMNQENKGMYSNNTTEANGSTTTTTEAKYSKRRRQVMMRRQRRSKRRNFLEGSRSGMNGRVRTLKKLVPNGKSMCLDGLFRETADYILGLEMQVKVMQILVEVLSGASSKE